MKTLIWILGIAALAVALTLAARYNTGYLLLVLPPWRVEFSLNMLIVLLAGGFIAVYGLMRAVSATVRLPGQVRQYRLARRKEQARGSMLQALNEFFAGRYGRAEQAAGASLALGEHPALAAVIAARAAHELRAYERRDAFLRQAAEAASGNELAPIVTAADLLIEERRYDEALEMLKRLPRRHTAALRLELRAQQQSRNWEQVLDLAEELRRRNVFDATQAEQVRRHALVEQLRRSAADPRALEVAWEKAGADRTDRRVAGAAAQAFMALDQCERARRILEEALEAEWDSDLVTLYAECEGGDSVRRIERAEKWLKEHPRDAGLLLVLGRLCASRELWGKAQSYLEASLAVEPTHSAHLAMARLQDRLGNGEAARRHYRESLDLALARLRAATGGRRRTPL